jgi:hypothetical protein
MIQFLAPQSRLRRMAAPEKLLLRKASRIHSISHLQQLGELRIHKQCMTIAIIQVPVFPTVGTQPFAVFPAHGLHRQTQQDLFPDDITDLDKVTKIERNFRIFFLQFDFSNQTMILVGLVELVELRVKRYPDWFQATSTGKFEFSGKTSSDPNFPRMFLSSQPHLDLAQNLNVRGLELQVFYRNLSGEVEGL